MRRQRWRLVILGSLASAPLLFLIGYGSYAMWQSGWSFWAWWPMALCWAVAYFLAWHWQRKNRLLHVDFGDTPLHWTDRDLEAWKLVEARAKTAAQVPPDKLSAIPFYVETAQEMGLELARFYHPGSPDPISQLTIPEMLAVVELASHDLAEMVDQYLPGGHLLTVSDWRRARQLADWYGMASNVYWIVSGVFSPLNTAMRYVASQVGMSRPLQMLQANLLLWFYTAYVHRLGTYLIDLNSGRLRVGARRYRELLQQAKGIPAAAPPAPGGPAAAEAAEPEEVVRRVALTTFGQVKAGKSSLINALLGEQLARADVLPATAEITRYDLRPEGLDTRLELLDTVGYGHEGPKQDQLKATQEAACQSDLLLLVTQARNPARQADLEMLQALKKWFGERPNLKMPPVLGVMTHIDLLSPSLEWQPPYDLQQPTRLKERQIDEGLATVREQLGEYLVGVVPVCTAAGKVYGIQEWLLPAVAQLLDQAHAVALLRCLRNEADTRKIRRVFDQLLAAGKEAVKILWQGPAPPR
jgi:predicted GTPase